MENLEDKIIKILVELYEDQTGTEYDYRKLTPEEIAERDKAAG